MRSIKGELIPYLVKRQFSRMRRKQEGSDGGADVTLNPKIAGEQLEDEVEDKEGMRRQKAVYNHLV